MTLQTSGAISLSDVATEFEDTSPTSMDEFYGYDSLPESGEISMLQFYGKSNSLVVLDWATLASSSTSTSTDFTFTAPSAAKSVVIIACKNTNDYENTNINSASSTLTSTLSRESYYEIHSEYGSAVAVFAGNLTGTGSMTVTVNYASTVVGGNYGKTCVAIFLNKAFSDTAVDASVNTADYSSPHVVNINAYSGGLVVTGLVGNGGVTWTSGVTDASAVTPYEADYAHAYLLPAETTTATLSATPVGSFGYRGLSTTASWAANKFVWN
jgi:hypothetical protein